MAYQVSSIVYPAYTPVAPPVYSVSTPIYTPSPPPVYSVKSESSKMPSTTTTIVTSALTLTSYVTAQYSASPVPKKCDNDIIGTVQKLPQSVQTYVFEALSTSKASPCDYPAICADLKAKDVAGKVSKGCSKSDYDSYIAFENSVCGAPKPYPTSIIVTPTPYPEKNKTQELTTYTTTTVCPVTTSGKVTTTTSTITVTSCKAYCTAPPPPPPQPPVYPTGNNGTTTVTSTGKITSTIRIPGSSAPPAASSAPPAASSAPPAASSAPPVAPSAAPPASVPVSPPAASTPAGGASATTSSGPPDFTGAAVANAPAMLLAGAVGIFGWAFAAM